MCAARRRRGVHRDDPERNAEAADHCRRRTRPRTRRRRTGCRRTAWARSTRRPEVRGPVVSPAGGRAGGELARPLASRRAVHRRPDRHADRGQVPTVNPGAIPTGHVGKLGRPALRSRRTVGPPARSHTARRRETASAGTPARRRAVRPTELQPSPSSATSSGTRAQARRRNTHRRLCAIVPPSSISLARRLRPPTTQNWLRKGHTSEGIHDALFPASVGDGVWPPSYEHQRTGFPAGQPM